jgi:hypothetical protein
MGYVLPDLQNRFRPEPPTDSDAPVDASVVSVTGDVELPVTPINRRTLDLRLE